ncbi:MAG TPA: antibiotic biosynthesis monooxygenase [Tepidisphaeraceae bacterium]|jgi:autoinducer 2-degrading protein|nr:antibiotic biosynthesis monooxygenase [Tepidisphaeraceae bacterium]
MPLGFHRRRDKLLGMYAVAVTIFIKPGSEQAFIDATLLNARATRKEPGNLRFDVLRGTNEEGDPSRFMLYEVYKNKEADAAHHKTAHYLQWKQTVESLMSRPRESAKLEAIFYGDE